MPVNAINDFTIKNFLFRALKLTINAIKRKYIYNGYEVAFDGSGSWNFGYEFTPNVDAKDILHIHEYVIKNIFWLVFVAILTFMRTLTSQKSKIIILTFVFIFNKPCLVRPTLID